MSNLEMLKQECLSHKKMLDDGLIKHINNCNDESILTGLLEWFKVAPTLNDEKINELSKKEDEWFIKKNPDFKNINLVNQDSMITEMAKIISNKRSIL